MSTPPDLATSSDFAATLCSMQAFLKRRELEKEKDRGKEQKQGNPGEKSPSLISADVSFVAEGNHQGQGQDTMSEARQPHSQPHPHSSIGGRHPHPDCYKVDSFEESEIVYRSDLTTANVVASVEAGVVEWLTGSKISHVLKSTDESDFVLSANSANSTNQHQGRLPKDRSAPMIPQIVRRATDPETVSMPIVREPSQPTSLLSSFESLSESKWARQKISPLANLSSLMQSTPGLTFAPIIPGTTTNCEQPVVARQVVAVNSQDKLHYNRPFLLAFSEYAVPPSNIKDIRAAIKEGNDKMETLRKVGVVQAMPFVSRSDPLSTRLNNDRLHCPWSSTENVSDTPRAPIYEMSTTSPSGRLSGPVFKFKQPQLTGSLLEGYRGYPTAVTRGFRSRSVA